MILVLMLPGAVCMAQDFQKSYSLAPESSIRIRNISGEVSVSGYDGASVIVEGIKTGRQRDRVEIVDRSSELRVDVDVRYPENCNCDAGVNFQVRVPRSVKYNFESIRSISGDVYIREISGRIRAESISGRVQLRDVSGTVSASSTSGSVDIHNLGGLVSASSTSGSVEVFLAQVEGAGDMQFSSISGNVVVRVPASMVLDANVTMSTLSGRLTTDFPIEIQQRRYAPGYSARGRLGAGTHNIRITSVSGRVSLVKDAARGRTE
jgi:DUF4097 and DUF4098 domain-containing protein YvlB